MSLLDKIASTNDAQIAAIDAELEALHTRYLADRAELRTARSILVGRRKRLGRELANGQAELPFEPASAVVVTDHLAQIEREAEEEDDADAMHAAHPVFAPPDPDAEPRLRRRKGVAGG